MINHRNRQWKGLFAIARRFKLLALSLLLLASCKLTEVYHPPSGVIPGTIFRDVPATDTTTISNIPWNQFFTDTLLQKLIREGLENNHDLKIALLRIKEAQANVQLGRSAFFPLVQGHATYTDQKAANNSPVAARYFQLYGSASWEADVWGKLQSSKRAALAALMQSEAFRRAVQTQLISDITTFYITLMAYDAQLATTRQTVENRKQDVLTMQLLKESGVVTGAALVQSQANLYSAEVTIPDLIQNIRLNENALSVLIGRSPGVIQRDSLARQKVNSDLHTGVPAQLLAYRPDVQQAEAQLRISFEMTKIARSYFYPSLTITAQGGLSNVSLSKLFSSSSSLFGSVIGGLTQPILNQGLNKQRLTVAKAQQEESLETFKKTLLTAGQEVSDAISSYNFAGYKMEIRAQQIIYLQKSVEFTKELLRYSANTNYTDVLTSEQNLLAAQLSSVNDKVQQLQAIVALYRSLGGGWQEISKK